MDKKRFNTENRKVHMDGMVGDPNAYQWHPQGYDPMDTGGIGGVNNDFSPFLGMPFPPVRNMNMNMKTMNPNSGGGVGNGNPQQYYPAGQPVSHRGSSGPSPMYTTATSSDGGEGHGAAASFRQQSMSQQPHHRTQLLQAKVATMGNSCSARSSPSSDLLFSKRAAVIASLKQRANMQTSSSPARSESPAENNNVPTRPTAARTPTSATPKEHTLGFDGGGITNANSSPRSQGTENTAPAGAPPTKAGELRNTEAEVNKDPVQSDKQLSYQRASAADIDGLLAEGRAAAANCTAKMEKASSPVVERSTTYDHASKMSQAAEGTENGVEDPDSDGDGAHSGSYKHDVGDSDDGSKAGGKDDNSKPARFRPVSRAEDKHPERRLCEPPKRTPTFDSNIPPARRSVGNLTWHSSEHKTPQRVHPAPPPVQASKKPEHEHEFVHLRPEEAEELHEWLVLTGYYDEAYRRKVINRRRRLAALEAEKAELMREEQEERETMAMQFDQTRSTFIPSSSSQQQPSYRASSLASSSFSNNKSSSISISYSTNHNNSDSKPAPPATAANATPLGSVQRLRTKQSASAAASSRSEGSNGLERDHSANPLILSPGHNKLKRSYGPSQHAKHGRRKVARLDNNVAQDIDQDSESQEDGVYCNEDVHQPYHQSSDRELGPAVYRGAEMDPESGLRDDNFASGTWHHGQGLHPGHDRGRGGGRISDHPSRDATRGGDMLHARPYGKPENGDLEISSQNTRFFLIKSVSYQNVEDSQQEGSWATQLKNVNKLVEAYQSCRNVILFFSVNSSKAFQGYARMDSLPDIKIPRPSWADKLGLDISPPFRVRWINTAKTKNKVVAHLTNSYNENSVVFFGRDGQEIEPHCGLELCKLLDRYHKSSAQV